MVERETKNLIKRLQINNVGIYKDFKEYCSKHEIKHEKRILGTPWHNAIVE